MAGKFLQEGADFLDAAMDLEVQKNRVYDRYTGTPLNENTVNNIVNLRDIPANAVIIGKAIAATYNPETFESFINGLREGYKFGVNLKNYENSELDRLGKLVEEHIKDKTPE